MLWTLLHAGYGFPVFSFLTTAKQGPAAMQLWECNVVVSCCSVVVCPGDAIVGNQDGVSATVLLSAHLLGLFAHVAIQLL